MRIPFGKYRGQEIKTLPEDYLCWIVKKYKGGFKVRYVGEVQYKIGENVFLEARGKLKELGYNTKGIEPVKD
ncbi:MAG TPA: DUF3820 family protein [Petrotogaceae bacterium]|nr:DUF3820 family protein [Petrotogaceae bacterium]